MKEIKNVSIISNQVEKKFQPMRIKGIALSFISLLLLAILPIITNSRPEDLNALSYSFYLSFWELVCSLPLFFIELRRKELGIFQKNINLNVKKKTYTVMGITGVIFSISTFVYVLAFETAGTISAAIAIQIYPLFSILWEFILYKKKKSWKELIFTIIIVIGLYYLGTAGTWLISGFSPWFGLALIVPFLWAIAHVIIKNTLDSSPITPNQVTFFRVCISSVVLFVISSTVFGIESVVVGFGNMEYLLFGFIMGAVYYLELVNWFYAVKHVDVSLASTITTPTPAVTMILAVIILGDQIYPFQVITMIIVFISLYGLLWVGKKN